MGVKIQFLGASGTVTGSRYLIDCDGDKILVDCGMFQGRKELRERNWEKLPFDPKEIKAVVLTHAHIDHTGTLPLIVKYGFKGPIYATPPTKALVELLLPDSAYLQEEEAKYANKVGSSKHKPAKPLYTVEDAEKTLLYLKPFPKDQIFKITPNIQVIARRTGHILGACSLQILAGGKSILFSGDVGRYDVALLPDPNPVQLGDMLICESTYGDRDHPHEAPEAGFREAIKLAFMKGGPLIVPAFAVGRTQTLLHYIAKMEEKGEIPSLDIFVDSPMAANSTDIYQKYMNDYGEDENERIKSGGFNISPPRLSFTRTVDESKRLNTMSGAFIVISASGMVNGGRIMHHISRWAPEEKATIVLVGYQAEETRGRQLLEGKKELKIFGVNVPIRAEVRQIDGLSGHGDRTELSRWLKSASDTPKVVKITHGEPAAAKAFSELINKDFNWSSKPAEHLETVEL